MTEDTREMLVRTRAAAQFYADHPGQEWDAVPASEHEREHTEADTQVDGAPIGAAS